MAYKFQRDTHHIIGKTNHLQQSLYGLKKNRSRIKPLQN